VTHLDRVAETLGALQVERRTSAALDEPLRRGG
jgi:hypothetical protein